jgi:hypothetical protein
MAEEGTGTFWDTFCQGNDPSEIICSSEGNVAADVLDTFNIEFTGGVSGGSLLGMDIKSMDAFTALKMSLLESSLGNDTLYEPITNPEGIVEFVKIGDDPGVPTGPDSIYYQIQSGTFQEKCSGVMVVGKRPLAKRSKAAWKPIWAGRDPQLFDTFWMAPNCLDPKFSAYCTIVFRDPHLETAWEDGIDNFYELKTPWENLLGYARYINWPDKENSPHTDIKRTSQSRIPIEISGSKSSEYDAYLGKKLQPRPTLPDNISDAAKGCFEIPLDGTANWENGVDVNIPKEFRYETVRGFKTDKLIGVSGVYIIGLEVQEAKSIPNSGPAEIKTDKTDADCTLMLTLEEGQDKVYKLSEGEHYQIAVQDGDDGPDIRIVFAENKRRNDPKTFGNDVTFKVDPLCSFYRRANDDGNFTGTILPVGGTQAYLVSQVFCIVDLDIPSIVVYDPRVQEGKAKYIAENLTYNLAPLKSEEPPAPVAFCNGGAAQAVDMTELQKDNDPTEEPQNFEAAEYTKALQAMDHGGGISLTLGCLDEDQCKKLAETLYLYMSSGNSSVTTYVCSPDSEPILGGYDSRDQSSVVNEIVYSYQDSNSYTISVSTGPRLLGDFAQIAGGPTYKMTEEVSARGTITKDAADNAIFKVMIDGYGELLAINCSPNILRVGDKVQVTVHNNPVEA